MFHTVASLTKFDKVDVLKFSFEHVLLFKKAKTNMADLYQTASEEAV